MPANLIIENIGGLRGKNTFKFKKGTLNIIEAPNSSGKTSIIKSLAGLLSATPNGQFKKSVNEEAKNLGIKSNEKNPQQGFVNVHSDTGKVELEINSKKLEYVVKQNGEIINSHINGNQDFLLAGILSNDSRILKQLNSVEGNEIEPGNFSWAVTELSSAKIYEEENSFLKEQMDDFLEHKYSAEQSIKMLEGLDKELTDLKIKKDEIEKSKEKLTKYVKNGNVDIKSLIKDRDKKSKDIQSKKEKKSEIESEIKVIESAKIELENEIQDFNKKLDSQNQDLKHLNKQIRLLIEEKDQLEVKKSTEIPKLKKQREGVSGELNLFITAFEALKDSENEINCPLCKHGTISSSVIENHLNELRNERKNIGNKIGKINTRYKEVETEIEQTTSKITAKELEIQNTKSLINDNEEEIERKNNEMSTVIVAINEEKKNIENATKEFELIKSKINKEDVELDKELTELEKNLDKIQYEIRRRNEDKQKSSFKFGKKSFDPKTAQKKYEKIIELIKYYIEYTEQKAEDQKQKAKDNFNKNIKELINNLGFKEFRNIKLNDAYQLYVERLDENSGEYVLQQVKTLSTSEKSAIALILQIALKQMYLSDIDFLILDDVLANFDDDKKLRILDYLSKKAKDEDWFIVLTNLKEEESPLKVEYWR